MNKEYILNTARKFLSNITEIRSNLYKGLLLLNNDKIAGIYYIDVSNEFLNSNFKDYQEQIFSDVYYKDSGNIQWNYYLILLTDNIESKEKQNIEKDDKYARKYIFNENEFNDFYNLTASKKEIKTDLVIEWKRLLDSVYLQDVYNNSPIKTSVRNFLLENKIIQPNKNSNNDDKITEPIINNIDYIKLNLGYRPIPQQREFNFKKVNLIEGINGVGKTSLLEAIELILCGKCFRNPDKELNENAILATYNSDKILSYSSSNNIYRNRDLFWYNNDYSTKNFLYQSFNRYNFFNSDAAYSFSNSNHHENIKNSLVSLSLGSEYNFIRERANKFYTQLRAEYNKLDSLMTKAEGDVKKYEMAIKQSKHDTNIKSLESIIHKNILELKSKKQFDNLSNYLEVEEFINEVKNILEGINNNSLTIDSITQLILQKDKLNTLKLDFDNYFANNTKLENEINTVNQSIIELNEKYSFLKECTKYFNDERFFKIDDLHKNYIAESQLFSIINHSKSNLKNLDLNTEFEKIPISKYIEDKTSSLNKLNDEQKRTEDKIKNILKQLSDIERIIKEIKLLGINYTNINRNASECPLCQTPYTIEELTKRINTIIDKGNDNDEKLNDLYNLDKELNRKIEHIKSDIQNAKLILKEYKYLIETISDSQESGLFNEIISYLNNKFKLIDSINESIQEYKSFEKLMDSFGISLNDYLFYSEKIKYLFGDSLKFIFENKDNFTIKQAELQEILNEKRKNLNEINSHKNQLHFDFKNKLNISEESQINDTYNNLLNDIHNLDILEKYYSKLKTIIKITNDENIENIIQNIKLLEKNIISYKNEIQRQNEFNFLENQLSITKKYIDDNNKLYKKLRNAKEILEIIIYDNIDNKLNEFFTENLAEIIDIFMTIHVPKEFKNIIFDRELILIDDKNKYRKVTEISSGQRSALALTIFITLNRKLINGPYIILFDDPITYVDDFNVLSFIDFLRLFILKERQIFFATANKKLSNIFKRKFEFLGSEFFKIHPLNREY